MTSGTIDPAPAVTAPAPEPARKNAFQRITGVLFAPGETYEDIARKPDVLVPLVLILLLGYAATFLVMPLMDWDSITSAQAEQMRKQNQKISDADMERMGRFTKAAGQVMGWIGPLFYIVWYLIVAGVLLLAFRLFGGQGTFKQAFSATVYSWMPLVLFSVISTIVIVARGTFDPTTAATIVKSNPAFLVDMKEQPVLFSLLSSFDVFTIWTLVLLTFGFAALSRLSRAKSAVIVFSLWIAMLFIKVGFAAIGAARASS